MEYAEVLNKYETVDGDEDTKTVDAVFHSGEKVKFSLDGDKKD